MFCIIDNKNAFKPIKLGFKKASQANNWCKKNLPLEETRLWGDKRLTSTIWNMRYFVMMK